MSYINIEKNDVPNYIVDMLDLNSKEIKNDGFESDYHHNTGYDNVLSILNYGILSLSKINELGIKKMTDKQLLLFDDTTSHINGINGISLSKMGLTDLYKNEEEYFPYSPNCVDYIISSDVKASRNSYRYGNEFISYDSIDISMIKSIDCRLKKLIANTRNKDEEFYSSIINKYNILLKASKKIVQDNKKIIIREMSEKELILDINSLRKMPLISNK